MVALAVALVLAGASQPRAGAQSLVAADDGAGGFDGSLTADVLGFVSGGDGAEGGGSPTLGMTTRVDGALSLTRPIDWQSNSVGRFFPGPSWTDRWGVRLTASVDGVLSGRDSEDEAGGDGFEAVMAEELSIGLGVLSLSQFATFQPPSRFEEAIWLPRDDLLELGGSVELAVGQIGDGPLYVLASRLEVAHVRPTDAGDSPPVALDVRGRVAAVDCIFEMPFTNMQLSGFVLRYARHELLLDIDSERVVGVSDREIEGTFVELQGIPVSDQLTFDLELGVHYLVPVQSFEARRAPSPLVGLDQAEDVGRPAGSTAFVGSLAIHWWDAPSGAMDDWSLRGERYLHVPATERMIRVSTLHRLDPSGFAVDYGGMVDLELGLGLARGLEWRARGTAAVAARTVVSNLAPSDIDGSGTVRFLGRLETEVSWSLSRYFTLLSDAWVEHSDRQDLRTGRRGDAPELDYGLELGVRLSL